MNKPSIRALGAALLLGTLAGEAATLDDAIVNVADSQVAVSTRYTLTFTVRTPIQASAFLQLQTTTGGPDFSGASLAGLTGGSLQGAVNFSNSTLASVRVSSGSASSGQSVTIELDGVVNPGTAGTGPAYTVNHVSGLDELLDSGTAAGNDYSPGGLPFVKESISSPTLDEEDGTVTLVSDLNTIFGDADGDPLSFSLDGGNDSAVATAAIVGSQLTVTPVGTGSTAFTVRASDLPSGSGEGEVTTDFSVTVIGALIDPAVTPSDLRINAIADYLVEFETVSPVGASDFLILRTTAGGPDFTNAKLLSLSGGTLQGQVGLSTETLVSIAIQAGSVGVGQPVLLMLGDVVNPSEAGPGPDYVLSLSDGTDVFNRSTIPGTLYEFEDFIYRDGFEGGTGKGFRNAHRAGIRSEGAR